MSTQSGNGVRRVTVPDLREMKRRGEKIAVLTAYDYLFARLVDGAGVDVVLVGGGVHAADAGVGGAALQLGRAGDDAHPAAGGVQVPAQRLAAVQQQRGREVGVEDGIRVRRAPRKRGAELGRQGAHQDGVEAEGV